MKTKNKTENYTTFSNEVTPELTLEDVKKACEMVYKREEKELPKGLSWFTKIMNKLGWHRKYEIMIYDKSKFGFKFTDNFEL